MKDKYIVYGRLGQEYNQESLNNLYCAQILYNELLKREHDYLELAKDCERGYFIIRTSKGV